MIKSLSTVVQRVGAVVFLLMALLLVGALAGLSLEVDRWFRLLALLVFALFIASILASIRAANVWHDAKSWLLLAPSPAWVRRGLVALVVGAFLSAMLAGGAGGVSISLVEGSMLGPRELVPAALLGMFFSGTTLAMATNLISRPWLISGVKCPAGHPLRFRERFCPRCGVAVEEKLP